MGSSSVWAVLGLCVILSVSFGGKKLVCELLHRLMQVTNLLCLTEDSVEKIHHSLKSFNMEIAAMFVIVYFIL